MFPASTKNFLFLLGNKHGLVATEFIQINYPSFTLMVLNPLPNKPWFLRVCSTSLWKTLWEKEKLVVTSNFFLSHSVFYPFGKLSANFIKFEIVVCKLFQFGSIQNLSCGKGLNYSNEICLLRRK